MRNSVRSESSWTGHRRTAPPAAPVASSAREQVAVGLEHEMSETMPIGRKSHSVPRARSQRTTPISEPTASSRLSCRIEGR